MSINLFDPEITIVTGARPVPENHAADFDDEFESVTTSAQVSGIELRMLPPLIKDNQTIKVFPFPGYASLYCLTIVVSDANNQLVGNIDLKGFARIGDNENLPINKTLFYWQAASEQDLSPNQIHVMCTIVKSKKGLRDVGEILGSLRSDNDYTNLVNQLKNLGKDIASFNVVTDTIEQIAAVVGKYMGHVEDKALGSVINSYTTLHGDFDKTGVNPYEYNTRNIDFNFQVVVRNKVTTPAASATGLESTEDSAVVQSQTNNEQVPEEEPVHVDMQPL